ncbi:hypothetical protein WJX84_003183, partial [Apatococcus fuscideae]
MPCLTGERYLFGSPDHLISADAGRLLATNINNKQQIEHGGMVSGVSCIASDQAGNIA